MDFRRGFILLIMDVLLVAELTFAIWWAHFEPAAISWRFVQVFVPAAALTVLATRLAFKRWAPKVKVSREEALPTALAAGEPLRRSGQPEPGLRPRRPTIRTI